MNAIALILAQLDQAYNRRSWHGTNLKGSIRGLSAAQAAWRPRHDRHNIHEIVVHAAYWKYAVHRRLTGEARGGFPLSGSNWFDRDREDENQWAADRRLLDEMHRRLREAVGDLAPGQLPRRASGGNVSNVELISGIIAHDVYHAGQIQLLKRLRDRSASSG